MNSGNHMVDEADRLSCQGWSCPMCGSRQEPVDTGYCGNFADECRKACHDRIEQYRYEDIGLLGRIIAAAMSFLGIDPYYGIELQCPEYHDAVCCESCGHVERL